MVLSKFRDAGLKPKEKKCVFGVPRVEFLGFIVDGEGIHPTPEKTRAIRGAPRPQSKAELQAFLGLLNFYAVFILHKASVAEPLHRLLDKHSNWHWGSKEELAFNGVTAILLSNNVLAQYSPGLPLVLTCDASQHGVGAVLSHKLPN
ncbi:uncharacterized protein [Erythrolamprus reginae]|uniref:uncharacterized protein n=1 Tax=Erythrolamprus reginae TaxID=121349 RepID=UPI00396CC0F6